MPKMKAKTKTTILQSSKKVRIPRMLKFTIARQTGIYQATRSSRSGVTWSEINGFMERIFNKEEKEFNKFSKKSLISLVFLF